MDKYYGDSMADISNRERLSKKQKKFIKKKRDKDREQLAMIRIQNEGKK